MDTKTNRFRLKPYQKIPVEYMKDHRALILYHSTGSGKTITSLIAMSQFSDPITIVGPKSSKKTFDDHLVSLNITNSVTFYTFSMVKKILTDDLNLFENKSVIVDEAHHLRTENFHNLYIQSALSLSNRLLFLTATPIINYINDLSVLVNTVQRLNGTDLRLPTETELFDQMFYDPTTNRIINKSILFERLLNTLSYYKSQDLKNFPTFTLYVKEIEMSHRQMNEYVYYIRKIFYSEYENVADDRDILNIDYAQLPSKKRNQFLSATRQLSNTVDDELSPKIRNIFSLISTGPKPAIVYSNYLHNGIYPLAIHLEKHLMPYGIITGNTTSEKLDLIVNNYNKGDYDVLLLSSAGSESLDLKNTKQLHIMEPHWNEAKINQVIGRTIRYGSHNSLPKDERNVEIYRWVSTFIPPIRNESADQYLMALSLRKQELSDRYQDIIKEASIEKNWWKVYGPKRMKYLKYKNKYLQLKGELDSPGT